MVYVNGTRDSKTSNKWQRCRATKPNIFSNYIRTINSVFVINNMLALSKIVVKKCGNVYEKLQVVVKSVDVGLRTLYLLFSLLALFYVLTYTFQRYNYLYLMAIACQYAVVFKILVINIDECRAITKIIDKTVHVQVLLTFLGANSENPILKPMVYFFVIASLVNIPVCFVKAIVINPEFIDLLKYLLCFDLRSFITHVKFEDIVEINTVALMYYTRDFNVDIMSAIICQVYLSLSSINEFIWKLRCKDVDEIPGNKRIYAFVIRSLGEQNVLEKLRIVTHMVDVICDMTKMINDICSDVFFLVIVTLQVEMLYVFYFAIKYSQYAPMLNLLLSCYRLFVLMQFCSLATAQFKRTVQLINEIDCCYVFKEIQQAKDLFNLQSQHQYVDFSAGFYTIDYSILIGIIAFTTTVFVITMQIEEQEINFRLLLLNATA